MTWETIVFAAVAFLFLFLLLWLLREPASRADEAAKAAPLPAGPLQIEDLFPLHCRHYPQMRQVFLGEDEEFLGRRASARIRRRCKADRQRVGLGFLAGLREDFQNLSRLTREAAKLSPKLSEKQEAELLWLGLRFQALYVMVQLRLRFGLTPLAGLTELSNMVGNLASGVEKTMASLEEASVAQLRQRPEASGS